MTTRLELVLDCADAERLARFWIEAEAQRLVGLGARRLLADAVIEHGTRWIVMADPEGNEFCVCQA